MCEFDGLIMLLLFRPHVLLCEACTISHALRATSYMEEHRRKATTAACSIVRSTDGLSSRQKQPLGVPSDMNGPSSAFIAIAPMASIAELYFSIVSPVVN